MPIRQPAQTPLERRAQRIRKTFLICFAAFVLIALLLVAYVGLAGVTLQSSVRVEFDEPPDGRLVFSLDDSADAARRLVSGELKDASNEMERIYSRLFKKMLAPRGELHFWKPANGQPGRWALFVSITRFNRFYMKALTTNLEQSRVLAPAGSTPAKTTIGYFSITNRGLLVSSDPQPPNHNLIRSSTPIEAESLHYDSPAGHVPQFLIDRLSPEADSAIASAAGARIHMEWVKIGSKDDWHVAVTIGDSQNIICPYFEPLIPTNGSSKP